MDIGFLLDWNFKKDYGNLQRKDEEKGYLWMVESDYDSLDWNCTIPKPNLKDLENIQISYNTWAAANKYKSDRQYPKIEDQLDMLYHDSINGTTIWRDTIKNIKEKFPK